MSEMLECTIQPRTEKDKAYLVVACRLGFKGQCKFPCWTNPASHIMWHWDGAAFYSGSCSAPEPDTLSIGGGSLYDGGNITFSGDSAQLYATPAAVPILKLGTSDHLPATCELGQLVNVKGALYLCTPQAPEWEAIVTEKRKKR